MIYDLQKASLLKRFSAFLLDFILICVLAAGFMFLIGWITGYDGYLATWEEHVHAAEEKYGVKFDISDEEYASLSEEDKAYFENAKKDAYSELIRIPEALKARNMMVALPLPIVTIGLLLSFVILEFVLPLIFKNGQTLGKKVFSIGVVFQNSVRITTFALFVRAIFGKYTITTLIPVVLLFMTFFYGMMGLTGVIVSALILILQLILIFATKNKTGIHDVLASTVVVDLSSQLIFANASELMSYKEQLHEEEVKKVEY